MRLCQPDYYADFHCLGVDCGDNCCIGWEIDIDDETNDRYQALPCPLGDRLRAGISDGRPGHFLLRDGRCPFLNQNNLCDIIETMGEKSLCQICADHPRFYTWLDGRREAGVGLCCEAAGRLVFASARPAAFTEHEADEEEAPSGIDPVEQAELLRARQTAFALLQNRRLSIGRRIQRLLYLSSDWQDDLEMGRPQNMGRRMEPAVPAKPAKAASSDVWRELVSLYREMEPIDPGWPKLLDRLERGLPDLLESVPAFLRELGPRLYEYEHLAVYYVYRYFMGAVFDGELLPRVKLAAASLLMQLLLDTQRWRKTGRFTLEDRIDRAKAYSKELEYCEENLEALLAASWELDCLSVERLQAMLEAFTYGEDGTCKR